MSLLKTCLTALCATSFALSLSASWPSLGFALLLPRCLLSHLPSGKSALTSLDHAS